MKKVILIIATYLMMYSLQAQHKNPIKTVADNWKSFKATHQQSAKQLAQNKAALSLSEQDALQLIATTKDELDYQHYRYQQSYKGIPIEGAVYLIHEKEGKVTLSNGQLIHHLKIQTKPTISKNIARKLAIQHIPAKLYAWESAQLKTSKQNLDTQYYPKGSLTIIDPKYTQNPNNYHLAYKFKVFALEPFIQNEVYVDAHNGDILLVVNNIHSCTETSINAQTNYSGRVNISVCADNGTPIHLKSSQFGGLEVRDDTDGNLLSIEDSLAAEVLWATQKTFDYFNTQHNRSISDSVTISIIDYSDVGAFYLKNDGVLLYGGGNGTTHNAYTTPDIVGHELTHGINKFSANLNISYESGALNESFADIFGELVEDYCLGNSDWILGAPVSPNNNGLRNLASPKDETMKTQQPNTYLGENWIFPSSVCIWNNDYCGVHRNSGVQNYWFYLLAEGGAGINDNDFDYNISGIGKAKAAKIAYRNLTTYLIPTSNYKDARQGSIQAAIDLFGANSFEVEQTRKAWSAVGVTNNPINIKTLNETILSNNSLQNTLKNTLQFELQVDSLNQMMLADGLMVRLDDQDNYDIISIELMHPDLQAQEVNISNNEILVNRIGTQAINTNESLVKITAQLKPGTNNTAFEIQGGTFTHHSGFIPFEDIAFNIPFNNCKNENGIANWLPLLTSINYETCGEAASVEVKIVKDKMAPYTHIWTNSDTLVYQYVGYEKQIEVPNLKAILYQVTVNDAGGNCTALEVKIPLLANPDGNNFCGNRCPEYLVTPAGNLQGTYNAKKELEVKGFINKHQNASFKICN